MKDVSVLKKSLIGLSINIVSLFSKNKYLPLAYEAAKLFAFPNPKFFFYV